MAKIRPEICIFAGVNPKYIKIIKDQLRIPEERYITVTKKSQIKSEIAEPMNIVFEGNLECEPEKQKVAQALLIAKKNKQRLVITNKANYKYSFKQTSKHCVYYDIDDELSPVIVANYAFSINADIKFIQTDLEYSSKEIAALIFDNDSNEARGDVAREINASIKSELDADFGEIEAYDFVTFYTDEIPYGYFYPNIASTHILGRIMPGYFIAESIANPEIIVKSALLVDTGFFSDSETDDVSDLLAQKEVITKEFWDNQFTNYELSNSIQFYPYDLLFICSHGGLPEGQRFDIQFVDSRGCEHVIVVDAIDSFEPTGFGTGEDAIINVKSFYEFVELDGSPWYEKTYKPGSSKKIVSEFSKLKRKDWKVLKQRKVKNVNYCNVIVTKGVSKNFIPSFSSLSDPESFPFVFNNACISNHVLSSNFIYGGASTYIGTVKSVKNTDAVNVAKLFFNKTINMSAPFPKALWESQEEAGLDEKVYVITGCHFLKFKFEGTENENLIELKHRLSRDIERRSKRVLSRDLDKSIAKNHMSAAYFLKNELEKL
ncbi:MAG: hypothetical protein CO156_01620 [Candidatus Pacebacteria bacterium CG_4_9_14_3_um_filter_40_12]|nr:MAG: hypothetical protein COU64_04470 [Candidatus Pacebacteria bacterium CG10_big_fil_rev_8_21_14_0_10_40_26]PJA69014.1 MAG: hypothetical protein CO156_01620 [Candidatus Pacebacteria bacterium CG_4_9_14_3_um_filter_40_12]PJC41853.1 MAG: hypothetical protein CO041_03985 [Candidatus Pacebacteria bacterium CG_4_9_14_0_2_um_filter_40_15]